ncbi:MAG: hypothetical protein IID58_00075 [Proteobacteria bacterium]|nr:hypothetical protein [Pseudomonadota bacterium]
MSARRAALIGSMLMVCGLVLAADEDIPDMEFLEYLGLWEESDEDWLIFNVPMSAETDERSDPVPEGEESTEKDNES